MGRKWSFLFGSSNPYRGAQHCQEAYAVCRSRAWRHASASASTAAWAAASTVGEHGPAVGWQATQNYSLIRSLHLTGHVKMIKLV